MADPQFPGGFRDLEELLEASVFHPSPCRRLRERVIHRAAVAQHRQFLNRRAIAIASIMAGVVLLALFVVPLSMSSRRVEPATSAPGHLQQTNSDAVAGNPDSGEPAAATHVHADGKSLGERCGTIRRPSHRILLAQVPADGKP